MHRAQQVRVVTTDDIIFGIAKRFAEELAGIVTEDYSGFEFLAGWLAGVKNRHGLRRVRTQGETVIDDPIAYGIPAMRDEIREQLKDYPVRV